MTANCESNEKRARARGIVLVLALLGAAEVAHATPTGGVAGGTPVGVDFQVNTETYYYQYGRIS
jgi:hypothetical protein